MTLLFSRHQQTQQAPRTQHRHEVQCAAQKHRWSITCTTAMQCHPRYGPQRRSSQKALSHNRSMTFAGADRQYEAMQAEAELGSAAVQTARGELERGLLNESEFLEVQRGEAREWTKVFDDKHQQYFYKNQRTGETSWTRPFARALTAGSWSEIWDPGFKCYYYVNSVTKEKTWEKPKDFDGTGRGVSDASNGAEMSEEWEKSQRAVPAPAPAPVLTPARTPAQTDSQRPQSSPATASVLPPVSRHHLWHQR